MHGRKKQNKDEAKERERLQKATKFSESLNKILLMKKGNFKDKSLLNDIGNLLYVAPDFFTLWNYRREILIFLKEELESNKLCKDIKSENILFQQQEFDKSCHNELSFIKNCLKVNPKSYGTWHHRYWLIGFINEPNLSSEIKLCNEFLTIDERNFHCWNYRRYVAQVAKISPEDELKYSSEKINENFSNFSSWYYRSSLLKILFNSGHSLEELQLNIDQDYKKVQEAIYTDPTDQSVWLYLRWIFSLYANGINALENKGNFHSSISVKSFSWVSTSRPNEYLFTIDFSNFVFEIPKITLKINGHDIVFQEWNSANGSVWYSQVNFDSHFEKNHSYTFNLQFDLDSKFVNVTFIHSEKDANEHSLCFLYTNKYKNKSVRKIDSEKYQSLKDLLDLEPDNKWLNFTLAWLESDDEIMDKIIDKLIKIDSLRTNFYKDLRSKIVIKKFISANELKRSACLNLSNLKLHSLNNADQFLHISYLDLCNNELIKLGSTFSPLVSLKFLLLDSNSIYLVDEKLILPKLTFLSISNNRINKIQVIDVILNNFVSLRHLVLYDNPIVQEESKLSNKIFNRDLTLYFHKTSQSIESKILNTEFESMEKLYVNEVVQNE